VIREVSVGGRTARVEIDAGKFRYETLDGEYVVSAMGEGKYAVSLNGRTYRVVVGARGEVVVNGRAMAMEVFDPRDFSPARRGAGTEGRQEIASPMPGKVIRVLVDRDAAVEEGQGLVVVEAMKMQNEMKSPKAGRVVEIRTKAGATVAAGEVLVVVE